MQVLYQIAWREELLSFHLHSHAIILYNDTISKCSLGHHFYTKGLHQFTKLFQTECLSLTFVFVSPSLTQHFIRLSVSISVIMVVEFYIVARKLL